MTAFIRKIASISAALALGTLSSVALAEPVQLTKAQMDQVTAGAPELGQRRALEILSTFSQRRGLLSSPLGRTGNPAVNTVFRDVFVFGLFGRSSPSSSPATSDSKFSSDGTFLL